MDNTQTLKIGKRSFIITAVTLFLMITLVGIIAQFVPTGSYVRTIVDGIEKVDYNSFEYTNEKAIPLYYILLAPFKVLASKYVISVIGIFYFIAAIGAAVTVFEKSGIIKYSLMKIINRYKDRKYLLLRIIILFFMGFSSIFGLFEELIAFVPIMVALSFMLNYDTMVGLGISIFAAGIGFASATFNPFTLGVAQGLANIPLYSGILFRVVVFIIMYIVTSQFIVMYAKKLDKNPEKSLTYKEDEVVRDKYKIDLDTTRNENLENAIKILYGFLALMFAFIFIGFFVKAISSILIILIATLFFISGIVVGYKSKYSNAVLKDMGKGILMLLPAVLLMILAVSITYLLEEAHIMDTVLYKATSFMQGYNVYVAILFIYLFVMSINFFIPAGASKALLTIPILIPITQAIGISEQTTVQAFLFGDGFSNIFFVTNPILMICLGLTTATYIKWVRWTIGVQAIIFIISTLLLFVAVAIGY